MIAHFSPPVFRSQEPALTASLYGPDPQALTWFVVFCAHRSEFGIVESLLELGFDAYCPAETRWKRSARRKAPEKVALLPGYLFVGLDRDRHGDFPFPNVRSVEGVVGLLGIGEPKAVPFGGPTPDFEMARKDDEGPRSLWEMRALEAAGVFDYTRNAQAGANAKKAKVRLRSFTELAVVLSEKAEEAA